MAARPIAGSWGGALALCLFASPGVAQPADDAWFLATTQALMDAVTSGDPKVWERALAADCTVTNEDGDVFDKARMLKDLTPLPPGFSGEIKVRELTVKHLGDAAVVHYWLDEREQIFGQTLRTTYVETDTYRRTGNTWQVLAMHTTVVPRDLEPLQPDPSAWPPLLGDYAYSEQATSRYHVFMRDGVLYGGGNEKTATRLIPLAPLVYYQQGSIHLLIFVRDPGGAVNEVRELHKYNEVRMQRVATPK
jgi:Domain of unknown function (DUF4440)